MKQGVRCCCPLDLVLDCGVLPQCLCLAGSVASFIASSAITLPGCPWVFPAWLRWTLEPRSCARFLLDRKRNEPSAQVLPVNNGFDRLTDGFYQSGRQWMLNHAKITLHALPGIDWRSTLFLLDRMAAARSAGRIRACSADGYQLPRYLSLERY